MPKKVYMIDGDHFSTLTGFYEEIDKVLVPGCDWGHNLDAFDDILDGGYGTPKKGFILVWRNARKSQRDLGYPETLRWLETTFPIVHEQNIDHWRTRMDQAKREEGSTLFLTLIDIIVDHEGIELRLS